MSDSPPDWYDPIAAAYWRMTRQIEREFLTGVDEMRMGPGKAPKLRAALKGRASLGKKLKRTITYVAVVVRGGFANYPYASKYDSGRSDGGWFALMGEDKDKLIEEALTKAKAFGGFRTYEVAVGVLDEMVVTPMVFKVVKL